MARRLLRTAVRMILTYMPTLVGGRERMGHRPIALLYMAIREQRQKAKEYLVARARTLLHRLGMEHQAPLVIRKLASESTLTIRVKATRARQQVWSTSE
jgi:hypothetical protein